MHTTKIDFQSIKAVVFDVDGTLYNQKKLRRSLIRDLLCYYLLRPHRAYDIKIIYDFRRQRENNHFKEVVDLDREQYEWGAQASNVSVSRVKSVIYKWIHERPLPHLEALMYEDVRDFFSALADRSILRLTFSDYPSEDKLAVMGLEVEGYVCSTDPEINGLKPHPSGLQYIMKRWELEPEELLFIGDRDDRDGECARRAGVPYLLKVNNTSEEPYCFTSYRTLLNMLV